MEQSTRGLSRADDLAHKLQVEIVTGRIPLGSRLRQEDLASRFGVSRTPVREALRQLQAIGLVDQLGHRGAVVRRFSPEECRNVYLVRAELEGLAAERSAGRLTGYDKGDLDVAQALLRTGYERRCATPSSRSRTASPARSHGARSRTIRTSSLAAWPTTTASSRRSSSPTRAARASSCTSTCSRPATPPRAGWNARAASSAGDAGGAVVRAAAGERRDLHHGAGVRRVDDRAAADVDAHV